MSNFSSPVVKVEVTGARGRSTADVARTSGAYGVLPTDNDEVVLEKLAQYLLDANPNFEGPIGPPGPADNTFSSYAAMQASDPTRQSARLVGDTDVPPHADGPYNNPTKTVGGWVPQQAAGISYRGRSAKDKFDDEIALSDARQANDLDDNNALASLLAEGRRRIRLPTGRGLGNDGAYLIETSLAGNGVPNVVSGLKLLGDGAGKTFMDRPYTGLAPGDDPWRSILFCNSGSADVADNIKDVLIRDITFRDDMIRNGSNVRSRGFRENYNMLHLNGVSRLTIKDCGFIGFRSDGPYFGSGHQNGTERHNEDVVATGLFCDGIDKNNRNAITIIDGRRMQIEARVINCTRPGDGTNGAADPFNPNVGLGMPGPFDAEMDAFAFHRFQDLDVTIRAKNCGGGAVSILTKPQGFTTLPISNLRVRVEAENCQNAFNFNGYTGADALTADKGYGLNADITATNCPTIAAINGDVGGRYQINATDCGSLRIGNGGGANRMTDVVLNLTRCGNTNARGTEGNAVVITASTDKLIFSGYMADCGVDTPGVTTRMFYFAQVGTHTDLAIDGIVSPTARKGLSNNRQFLAFGSGVTANAASRKTGVIQGWTAELSDNINLLGARYDSVYNLSASISYLNAWSPVGVSEAPSCVKSLDGTVLVAGSVAAGTLSNGTAILQFPFFPKYDHRIFGDCIDGSGVSLGTRSFRIPTTNSRLMVDGGNLPAATVYVRFSGTYRAA